MASRKTAFRLEGLKELEDALLELPKATQGNVLKRAVAAPAGEFAEAAAALAPEERGVLRENIAVSKPKVISPGQAAFAQSMAETGDRAEAAAAARAANAAAGGRGKAVSVQVGPLRLAFYGQFPEFGTAYQAAQPFMRPAWDANKTRMLVGIRDELATQIEKARARLARKAARLAAKS